MEFIALPFPMSRLFELVAGGVVVSGPLSVDDDEAFEGDGDWSLTWLLKVTIVPLPLPSELSGLLGPLLFIDWIGEKVFAADGMGDVLWLILFPLLLLLLFVLLLLLLQFNKLISGLRSCGDGGACAICPIKLDGSIPLMKRKKRNVSIREFDWQKNVIKLKQV